ncbi:MAG TPA: MFS transporter [Gaiellaceae bacterium]|nr:MFS transporter [Gaiellaceae bacterium]
MRAPGGLWRHRDFRSFWAAETISQFGTQVTFLALPLVAIIALQESTFRVALLTSVEFLPFLLFTLPAGVWVDRLRRRPILILGDVGRAVALVTVPIAHWLGVLTIWQLYAVGFVAGVCTVFFDVAYQSYLPSLVRRDQIVEGNAKLETSRSAASVAGPGFAGLLVSLLTAPVAILADAVSFLVSACLLGVIRTEEVLPPRDERKPLRTELLEGLRYVLGHTFQRGIVIAVALSNFFGQVVFSILLVYAVRELGLTAATIGVVFSLGSVGALVAAVSARRIGERLGVGRTIVLAALLFGPGTMLIAVAPKDLAVPFIVASMFVLSFGGILFNVTGISLIQAITPDRMLGRANASRRFVVWGVIPFGGFVGGVLASTIGLRETIFVGAIGGVLAVVPILLSPIRSVGRMSELGQLDTQSSPIASASSAPA